MPDVFISYSRRDTEFVKVLQRALEESTYEAWVDWIDIPKSADWWQEIERGIEAADTVIFVISPDSIKSEVCRKEVGYAAKNQKRLIPIVYREGFDFEAVHPAVSQHNWLFFREEDDFEEAFEILVDTINTDLVYVREHTKLLLRALEWERQNHDPSFLLQGTALNAAEQWIANSFEKTPHPLHLQRDYITASQDLRARLQAYDASYKSLAQQIKQALVYRKLPFRRIIQTSIFISIIVLVLRLAFLQPAELAVYDSLVHLRPGDGPDSRFLVIGINSTDIDSQSPDEDFAPAATLSEQSWAKLLTTLDQHHPRAIGIDIYRTTNASLPELAQQLSGNEKVYAVCKGDDIDGFTNQIISGTGMPRPPEVSPDRVGFSEVMKDEADNVVRRHLIQVDWGAMQKQVTCASEKAISFLLAQAYLEQELGEPISDQDLFRPNEPLLHLGNIALPKVTTRSIGYQGSNIYGYQTMLSYRTDRNGSPQTVFEQYTLTDLFNDRIPADAIQDRIVLVGVTDATAKPDNWATPFKARDGSGEKLQLPGVILHVHMTSQLISAVLDGRSLIWSLSAINEVVWIGLWTLIGGVLIWRCRTLTRLVVVMAIALLSLGAVCVMAFLRAACWLPIVPGAVAILLNTIIVLYLTYRPQPSPAMVSHSSEEQELVTSNRQVNSFATASFGTRK